MFFAQIGAANTSEALSLMYAVIESWEGCYIIGDWPGVRDQALSYGCLLVLYGPLLAEVTTGASAGHWARIYAPAHAPHRLHARAAVMPLGGPVKR